MPNSQPEVRVFQDIHEIDPGLWDSLLSDEDIQMSHDFVSACQDSRVADARFWHLAIYDRGELQCVTSLSKINVSVELLSTGMTRAAIRTVRRLLRGFLDVPVLFCGLPLSFGESCLRMRRGADTERMLCAIASTMDEIAGQQNVRLLCFKEFDQRGAREVDDIRKMGYIQALSLPSCCLPVCWKTFDDYVASTRAGYRRQIAATLRMRQECGLQIRRVGNFGQDVEAIYALYLEVMDRAPFQLERLNRSFF